MIDNNKAIKQAWIDAMQSNKEKDEQIKNLQKEVNFYTVFTIKMRENMTVQ